MSAALGVIARLEAISAVTALVSTRIYQGILPEHARFPAIRVQRISENEFMHMRGTSAIYRTRVQVDSISNAADAIGAAQALDAAVHGDGASTGLVGWRGTVSLGGSPEVTVEITGVLPAGVREEYDPDDLRQYRVMRDVFVWWTA